MMPSVLSPSRFSNNGRSGGWSLAFGMLVAACLSSLVGCGGLMTEYGPASGRTGRVSLNGFGALRNAYTNAGYTTRDMQRLSHRALNHNVIVWTPQTLDAIDPEAGRWFESWLATGNRTLVYVIPDSGSEAEYWLQAGRLAPPEQRFEYRRRAAKSVNDRIRWRLSREPEIREGWFSVEPLPERVASGNLQGSWASELSSLAETTSAETEFRLSKLVPDQTATKTGIRRGRRTAGQTGPSSVSWFSPDRRWVSETPTELQGVLKNEAGDPIVLRITSEGWNRSQVIVVAGGSLLTNFAFSRPLNRELAELVIQESSSATGSERHAGFLTTGWEGVRVSERQPGVPQATGMELLTVWPLSLVTIHGVMLGVVVCLMLLPVFGRPGRIRHRRTSHFGDHLDAVGALMNKAGGEAFARSRISDYMRRIRGETGGPWVLPETDSTTIENPDEAAR